MSRLTPGSVRKRMARAQDVSYWIDRALRGADDDLSRRIRAHFHEQFRDDPDIDLDNPDHVELVRLLIDRHALDFLSDPTEHKLRRGRSGNSGDTAAAAALADYEGLRRQGHEPTDALNRVANKFRADHPEHADKTDIQLKRLWYR
jgi:hypothetical protein